MTGRSQRLQLLSCLLQDSEESNRPTTEELLSALGKQSREFRPMFADFNHQIQIRKAPRSHADRSFVSG